jgi:hypothetical protein
MLDLSKPVQLRDGRSVDVLTTVATRKYPVVGLVREATGVQEIMSWSLDGWYLWKPGHHYDLINVPPKPQVRYLNVYRTSLGSTSGGALHDSREHADTASVLAHGNAKRVGCLRVVLEERFDE